MLHCNQFVTFYFKEAIVINSQVTSKSFAILRFCLSFFLILILVLSAFHFSPSTSAKASSYQLTSIGLAEHGLKAYRDKWQYGYVNGLGFGQIGKDGLRYSDCSGLLYAYFCWTDDESDPVANYNFPRGVTSQVNASIQHGSLSAMPRIHGLMITVPDPYDPPAPFSHNGIYVGDGYVVDNSDYGVNMRYGKISANKSWTQWHMLGFIDYPTNGWYAFDGKMYHYTNRQYDINRTITYGKKTYKIGSDGVVCDESGKPIPVDESMPNEGFSSANPVTVDDLFGGKDGTVYEVIGSSLNVRSKPSLTGSIVTSLPLGAYVLVTKTVNGDTVKSGSISSNKWHLILTTDGKTGYVTSVYVKELQDYTPQEPPPKSVSAPTFTYSDGMLHMSSTTSGADIYYTTDCSTPTFSSILYTGPISSAYSKTYTAFASKQGVVSVSAQASLLKNGRILTDVLSSKWYFNSVNDAVSTGIFSGTSDTTFSPYDTMTRGMFARIIANIAGVDLSAYSEKPSFSDVPSGRYYSAAIAWALENNIVNGFPDGTFRPEDNVTREQMCVIFANFYPIKPKSNSILFSDDSSISSWAKKAVYASRDNGIVSGIGNNTFAPLANAQRCEAAAISIRFANLFS